MKPGARRAGDEVCKVFEIRRPFYSETTTKPFAVVDQNSWTLYSLFGAQGVWEMKDFNARERRIISACYRDAARICWEREWEQRHNEGRMDGKTMAKHLAELCGTRHIQILKYKCHLPWRSRGFQK